MLAGCSTSFAMLERKRKLVQVNFVIETLVRLVSGAIFLKVTRTIMEIVATRVL